MSATSLLCSGEDEVNINCWDLLCTWLASTDIWASPLCPTLSLPGTFGYVQHHSKHGGWWEMFCLCFYPAFFFKLWDCSMGSSVLATKGWGHDSDLGLVLKKYTKPRKAKTFFLTCFLVFSQYSWLLEDRNALLLQLLNNHPSPD